MVCNAMSATIENLKTAIQGESKACAKYAAYASKAAQEGYPLIQKMFEAASKAERIHAMNHTKVLVKMGGEPLCYEFDIQVSDTATNLRDAIAGETYEFTDMYPPMIATAKEEGAADAVRSFSWANEAEKEHAALYSVALEQLEAGGKFNLPAEYYICPLCGDTFAAEKAPEKCPLCNVPKSKYILI